VLADRVRTSEQQDQPGEDVAERLLGRDTDDDSCDGTADQQPSERHGEHAKRG